MCSRSVRAVLASVALIAACDAPTINSDSAAYDPTALTGFLYHWSPGRTIAVFVDPTHAPADADLSAAVRDGIAAWSDIARLGEVRFRLVTDVTVADVIIHHAAAPRRVGSAECQPFDVGSGGYTFFCVPDDHPRVLPLLTGPAGRVKIDVAIDRAAAADAAQFQAFVVHELGHVLGIGAHSSVADDVMFASPHRVTPSARDASTLRFLLGRRAAIAF